MAGTIKRLSGDVSVGVTGHAATAFIDYGVVAAGGDEAFTADALRMNVFTDPTGGTVTGVLSATRGRANAQVNGRLALDLTDTGLTDPITVLYVRTGGSSPGVVTATITVNAALVTVGWVPPRYYRPEIVNDAVVIEPFHLARKVHIDSVAGLSRAQIGVLQGVSEATITNTWLRTNTAAGGGGLYYGESEALALNEDAGVGLAVAMYNNNNAVPMRVLYKCGGTYTQDDRFDTLRGYSKLYPNTFQTYGTGARPIFAHNPPGWGQRARNIVLQGWDWRGKGDFFGGFDVCIDHVRATGPEPDNQIAFLGLNNVGERTTLRRYVGREATNTTPSGATWGEANTDRTSNLYAEQTHYMLIEKSCGFIAGWNFGYRVDRDGSFPQSVSDRSHNFYTQQSCFGIMIRDCLLGYPSHSLMQSRAGGIFQRIFGFGANTGFQLENGSKASLTEQSVFSLCTDTVITAAGQKNALDDDATPLDGFLKIVAGALLDSGKQNSVLRYVAAQSPLGTPIATLTDIGPVGRAQDGENTIGLRISGSTAHHERDYKVRSWCYPDRDLNLTGLDTAVLDSRTINTWLTAQGLSGGPKELVEFLLAEDDPNQYLPSLLAWFLDVYGYGRTARTSATTVYFQPSPPGPNATGPGCSTPGIRSDIHDDWSTGDMPGTVAGDGIHLNGHRLHWNDTPVSAISALHFGGGDLIMHGGALKPAAITLDGPSSLIIGGGSKFEMDGYAGSDVLTIGVTESRFLNQGAMTGAVDLVADYRSEVILAWDSASYTIGAGRTLELRGELTAGFGGSTGGTATITCAGTLRMSSQVRLSVSGVIVVNKIAAALPRRGALVSNASGAVFGVVSEVIPLTNTTAELVLTQLGGVFTNGEGLVAATHVANSPYQTFQFGTISAAPVYTMPTIAEVLSGKFNGAPNVASTFVCGGALELDVTGISAGTYDLITADTRTGTFASVSSTGGTASVSYSVAGKVQLVVA